MVGKTGDIRTCLYFNECGKSEVYNGHRWKENWYRYNGGYICRKCYNRLISNPITNKKWNPINNPKNNPKHLLYKNKIIILKERRLTGKCELCDKKIGDEYINHKGEKDKIKITHTHHINYHDGDVLKDTRELCAGCHGKENKGKKYKKK